MSIAIDFAELYLAYHAKIYNYIFRRTSNEHLAEDLAAETFVKALDAAQRGAGARRHVVGWLHRIAHNLVIDHYKARDRHPSVGMDEVVVMPDTRRPDLDYETAWLRERIADAAAHCTVLQQQVVTMRLEGYTFDEIAAELEMSTSAVKAAQHRAFDRMSLILAADFEGERKTASMPVTLSASYVPTVTQIHQCLHEHGPLTVNGIVHHTGLCYATVYASLRANPKLFTAVGHDEWSSRSLLWGLVE